MYACVVVCIHVCTRVLTRNAVFGLSVLNVRYVLYVCALRFCACAFAYMSARGTRAHAIACGRLFLQSHVVWFQPSRMYPWPASSKGVCVCLCAHVCL